MVPPGATSAALVTASACDHHAATCVEVPPPGGFQGPRAAAAHCDTPPAGKALRRPVKAYARRTPCFVRHSGAEATLNLSGIWRLDPPGEARRCYTRAAGVHAHPPTQQRSHPP